MPVITIQKRKSVNQLGELLTTLYEDVLLMRENDEKGLSQLSNNTNDYGWKQFVKSNQIEFVYSDKVLNDVFKPHTVKGKQSLVINNKYVKQNITDKIVFTNKSRQVFTSLFSHIRNAFAHNQIFVEGEYVTMYDRLTQKSPVFTMIAHVKIEVLKELIKTIRNIKNKKNENN